MNELNSTVDVLKWNKADGSLTFNIRIKLLPASSPGKSTGCDTVISKDGHNVYFANRGDDFLYSFSGRSNNRCTLADRAHTRAAERRPAISRSIRRSAGW